MLKQRLIKKAQNGISFSGFDEKWTKRNSDVYNKNKDSNIWKEIAGDDDVLTIDELKSWQKSKGEIGDGKIGKNTLKKLGFNSKHNWITRDINRPQLVYTTGLNMSEEEKTKHPNVAKKDRQNKSKNSTKAVKTAHNINQVSGDDTTLYSYGIDKKSGKSVTIANRDLNNLREMEKRLQSLDPKSPEYEKLLEEYGIAKADAFATNMDEVVVRANPIYAADRSGDKALVAREGWIPVQVSEGNPYAGRVFKKTYGPDQYYITNGRGWIMGTSNDPVILSADPTKAIKAMWDTQRYDALMHDAYMQAYDDVANTETTQRVNNNWNPNTGQYGISTEDLIASMNNGKRGFINGASVIANGANHAIMGAIKAAFDDDYSLADYGNGFLGNPKNNIVGIGDAFDVQNPYLRTGLNFINPTSVMTGGAAYIASRPDLALKYNKLPDLKLTYKVPNSNGKVVGGVYRSGVHNATKYRGDVIPISTGGTHTETVLIPRSQMYYQAIQGVDGTPLLTTGVNLPYEQIQERSWTPDYQGTETVSYNPELEKRLATGRYAESDFDIVPIDENTVGGNYKWNGTTGRTIVTMPGSGNGKRKTKGKPSKN